MPTYPLPTLGCTVSSTGITAPTLSDIINSLVVSYQGIFGADTLLTPDTQDYQWLGIHASAINDSNNATIAAYNTFNPAYSVGVAQDSTYKLNGIRRLVPTNSTVPVQCIGVAGTVITNGVVQDANGYLWNLPASVTVPGGGSITVTATAQLAGSITITAGIATIYTQVLGWQSAAFTASATAGSPVESDGAFRIRQTISTTISSKTPLQAIAASIANLAGVSRSVVYENNTNTTDSNGIPPHDICAVVQGGVSTVIAQAIEATKAPGTGTGEGMAGITPVLVTDPAGVPIIINYYNLLGTTIYVSVTIHALSGYVATTGTALVNAIVSFINALAIGEDVYYNWLFGPASLYGSGLEFTYTITSITVGTAPAPVGTSDIVVPFNSAAVTDAAKVILTVA